MREDYEEELRKMFPNGYIITYIQPNTDPAYHWWNPKDDEFISKLLVVYEQAFNSENWDSVEDGTEQDGEFDEGF